MREALRLAIENASGEGFPFGAVVVKDGHIIGRGVNRVVANLDPSAHAEIMAIREACQTLGSYALVGCTLYSSCEPCPMCLSAIYWSRIERVYYAATRTEAAAAGFDDTFLYAELAKPVTERKLPLIRMLAEQSQIPFQEWEKNPNRVLY
jgi:guanine deaminase